MNLFDTSSIFTAIMENRIDILPGSTTIPLASYELGNIVWKKTALQEELTLEESMALLQVIKNVVKTMRIHENNGLNPDSLRLAQQEKLNYYDSSFIHAAIELDSRIITEDKQMQKTCLRLGVPVVSIKDV